MLSHPKKVWTIISIAAMIATVSMLGNAAPQKASVPKQQDKLALGEDEVKKLVVIMAPDTNAKISKAEYMRFMEAEFERLDKNKSGELEVKNLMQPTITASRLVGK